MAKSIRDETVEAMTALGTYKPEYSRIIDLYAGLCEQYERLNPIHRATSLDLPLGENEDGGTLCDLAPDPGGIDAFQAAEDAIWQGQLHAELDKALATLPAAQHEAVERRSYMGQMWVWLRLKWA